MEEESPSPLPSYLEASSSVELPEFTVTIEPFKADTDSHPGAIQRLWSIDFAAHPELDVRTVPAFALFVPEGESVSPFLPPGPFGAEWEGTLFFQEGGEHRFGAEGVGKVRVEVHGALAFEATGENLSEGAVHPHAFAPGPHPIRVRYESPPNGTAAFRLLWSSESFPIESVPPRAISHEHLPEDLIRADRLREGRLSIARHRCLACHSEEGAGLANLIPELDRDAPGFEGIGSRFRSEWMVHQILAPHTTRPESEMPALLGSDSTGESGREARLLAAYLSSLRSPDLDNEDAGVRRLLLDPSLRARGERIFQEQDCAACHLPPRDLPNPTERTEAPEEESDRLPLSQLETKWKPAALVAFLEQPDRHYKSIRMGDFDLDRDEAQALTAYLLDPAPTPEEVAEWRTDKLADAEALLRERKCLNCHSKEERGSVPWNTVQRKEGALPLSMARPDRGCLAEEDGKGGQAPRFFMEPEERENIRRILDGRLASLQRHVPSEYARARMEEMRCLNCHRDETEGADRVGWETFEPLGSLLADREGRRGQVDDFASEEEDWAEIPTDATVSQHQVRPDLVWAGEKLRTDWMETLFLGGLPNKTRPLLPARMPAFRDGARELAVGMAALYGLSPEPPTHGKAPDVKIIESGEGVLGEAPGLNCIACHPIGDRGAGSGNPGASINLDLAPSRLRRPFFERILRNPQRLTPNSPMPQFIEPTGRTAATHFFEGDAEKQIEAMWEFLASIGASAPSDAMKE